MISAVAILMLCNGIRIFLKSKKNTINEIGCVMEFMTHLFRFFIFSFLHFFVSSFFSSDFTDESEAFLLIGLLTDFRGYLASGQWLAPYICSCCFCHADFADGADFSLWGLFCPTDFTDIHRFFFVGLFPTSGGICTDRTGRLRENPCVIASSGKPPNKFRVIR